LDDSENTPHVDPDRATPQQRPLSTIEIPVELISAGARFILVRTRDKAAFETDWQTTANYAADSPKLLSHISAGGNYGVLSHNGICVMDVDEPEELKKLDPNFPHTFVVVRGNSGRGHVYFTCSDCPPDKRGKFETVFGDIRTGGNFYVVAPSCIHPSGDIYNIHRKAPLADVPWAEVERLIQSKPRARAEITGTFNLPDDIVKGQPGRNKTLFKYGCSLRALGRDDGEISVLIRDANTRRCKPSPLPEDEISILIRSVLQHQKGVVVIPERPFPRAPEPEPLQNLQIPQNYIIQSQPNARGEIRTQISAAMYADFLTNFFSIKYFNKTIYVYDHGNHLYRAANNEIESHIRDTVVTNGVSEKLQLVIVEVMTHIKSMGCYTEYPFNVSSTDIPVENGVVRINYDEGTVSLLPHSPEHLFTYKLSVKYNPEARNCHAVQLLKRMVEPKDIKTLIQVPAQALLQMQTAHAYKKAYILQGEPHAGKTSFLKLLYRLFGNDFTTAISLQQLCDNHFVGGALEGKLLNVYDDLEDVALDTIDQFKTLTGDCRHGIERKYETMYTGKITAVHIFSCNYPPEYPERVKRDAAFWARWEYLKFPYVYGVDPNFYTTWYTDDRVSAFFSLILGAMIHIKKRGLLSNSEVQDVMMMWSVNSDPLYDFVASIFEQYNGSITNKIYLSKGKLYNEYIKWCDDNEIPDHKRKQSIKAFTTALQAHRFMPERKKEKNESYETYTTTAYNIRPGLAIDLNYRTTLTFTTPTF
jgi:phage/plasmid-associated DNA primase